MSASLNRHASPKTGARRTAAKAPDRRLTLSNAALGRAIVQREPDSGGAAVMSITTERWRMRVRITPGGLIRVEGPEPNKGNGGGA